MPKKKEKHIVFIVENLSVPFDRRVWREAKTMNNAGFKVSVICPKGQNTDHESRVIIDGIEIFRYKIPLSQDSKAGYIKEYVTAFIATLARLIRIFARSRIHAIHVANPPDIFFPLGWIGKVIGCKFVFDQHDLAPETYQHKFGSNNTSMIHTVLLRCEKFTYKIADHVISTNKSIKQFAIGRGGKKEKDVTIIRNGPDKDFYAVAPDKSLAKGKTYLAAYIGVMGTQDGVDYIIKAVNYLINDKNFKDVYYILIGYGDEYENHKELIECFNLSEYIEMPGRLSDIEVLTILSSADICLAPDPKNGLNEFHTMNKIMDYMLLGKPIVSFDLKESIYSAGDAAVYIENNDYEEFGNAIINLLSDSEKCKMMGEFGKEKVEKELKWEYSINKLTSIYNTLLS